MHTNKSGTPAYNMLISILKPFRLNIAIMILTGIYAAFAFAFMPYLIRMIINGVTDYNGGDLFAILAIPAIAYICMQALLTFIFRCYDYFVTIRMIPDLRAHITEVCMELLLNQSHTYFQNNLSGNISNKVSELTSSIPDLIQLLIDRFMFIALLILFGIIILAKANIFFAIFMLVWVSAFLLYITYKVKYLTKYAKGWSEQGSRIVGRIVDIFSNFLSIQLFSGKAHEKRGLNNIIAPAVKIERKLQWEYFKIFLFYGISALLLTSASLYLLITGRQQGIITNGDFALVLMVNITIMDQLWMLAKDFATYSKLSGRIMQAFSLILQPPELVDSPNAKQLIVTNGKIDYYHVHFNYKGHDAVFKDKTITIPAGQKVGLVGYSGSGKTTFVNLILRLYDVSAGNIFIDQQDIKEVTQDSLHAAISMIPQDPYLFHRTLLENIRFAKPEASDSDVINAAKRAYADDFIKKLPQGYDSVVGERGIKLSGGQRQRVAIARAILKNAPILILDEATSQLDSITEENIQKSLWELMQNKTSIVIAHRLSTLIRMDRIIAFDQGHIVEEGTHEELLARKGLYRLLWDAQIGGFLPTAPTFED